MNLYFTATSGYQLLSNENDEFSLCMFDQSFEDKKMAGRGRGRAPGEYISLPPNAASHVDAYFEYRA
jgi:hypothetical protein